MFFYGNLFIISSMDLFNEGQKIALLFKKDNNIVEMVCSIEKIFYDRLNLVLPQYFMRYIEYLQVGMELTAKVFSKLGTIDFNTIIINSPLDDTFTIELDYNAINLTSGESVSTIKSVDLLEIQFNNELIKVKTFELATEFVKFTSNKAFSVGDNFEATLILPKTYGKIKFIAEITEIDPIYTNEFTANFITITEQAKQDLLYYMYMYTKDTD